MQNKRCRKCSGDFEVREDALAFYRSVSPIIGEAVIEVPSPTLCHGCRLQRRLAYRNQLYVFSRPSSLTGKQIFSMYPDNSPFPVVEKEYWWSDEWDAAEFGVEFDFSRPFFEQFERLRNRVPHFPLSVVNLENSDYCNNAGGVKNSYFVFNSNYSEDCFYCEDLHYSKDCTDCSTCVECEMCYDCVDCRKCYDLQSSQSCENCSESLFLLNCRGCRNCIGCVNLRQAQYCIFNEQLTERAYEDFLNSLQLSSFKARVAFERRCLEFFKTAPRPHAQLRAVEDVSGDYISHCRDVHDSFFVHDLERAGDCFNVKINSHDLRDVSTFGTDMSFVYESAVVGHYAHSLLFCFDCWNGVSELIYCAMCSASSNLFGCVGMRRKQYCILNKQYSRAEYESLVPKIAAYMRETGEWGEFFPMRLSTSPYNFSLAQRIFPLKRDQALQAGLPWYDRSLLSTEGAVDPVLLPDDLPETDSTITVRSASTGKAFRITGQEIRRCRKLNAPLPRLAYDERAEMRWQRLGGIKVYNAVCEKTGKALATTVNPAEGWKVWDREEYERHFSS